MRRALSFADDAAADAFTRQRASFVARHAADTHYDVSERYEIEDVALHGRAGGDGDAKGGGAAQTAPAADGEASVTPAAETAATAATCYDPDERLLAVQVGASLSSLAA